MRLIFNRFKDICPLSNETYSPTNENFIRWKRAIRLHEDHQKFEKTIPAKKNKMEIKSFEKLPFCTRIKVKSLLKEILIRYPQTKVVSLTGSHVRGEATELSDFDFILSPPVIAFFEFEGMKVDLIQTGRKQIKLIGS